MFFSLNISKLAAQSPPNCGDTLSMEVVKHGHTSDTKALTSTTRLTFLNHIVLSPFVRIKQRRSDITSAHKPVVIPPDFLSHRSGYGVICVRRISRKDRPDRSAKKLLNYRENILTRKMFLPLLPWQALDFWSFFIMENVIIGKVD